MDDPHEAEMMAALEALVSTVNNTGGVIAFPDGTHGCDADRDWIDLGDAYLLACKALGQEPRVRQGATL